MIVQISNRANGQEPGLIPQPLLLLLVGTEPLELLLEVLELELEELEELELPWLV